MGDTLRWLTPSYDFGSPVDEAGVVRPLFYALQTVLKAHGAEVPPSPLPAPPPVAAFGSVVMSEQMTLWDALNILAPVPVLSPTVRTFEEMGQGCVHGPMPRYQLWCDRLDMAARPRPYSHS
jgi:hypothetical protein